MRRPPLTRKKIDLILDSLYMMGVYAGVNDPDFVQEGSRTEQEVKDHREALHFMLRLLWWHEWKQEQRGK